MHEDEKKLLSEIVSSYNDDMALEKLHRDNIHRNLMACIIWIAFTIYAVWFKLEITPFIVTADGVVIMVISAWSIYSVHRRYKAKMKHILYARNAALQMKDNLG